jgi:hypothetical protein
MSAIKNTLARKAVKATAKHSAHGTASKLRRDPVRALALFGAGGAVGALVGWIAARGASPASAGAGS